MNQEERREKRRRERRNAIIKLVVALAVILVVIVGAAYAAVHFLGGSVGGGKDVVAETETETETEAAPVEIVEVVTEDTEDTVDELTMQAMMFVADMSLEDKVAQMFVITQDALTGVTGSNVAGEKTEVEYDSKAVGGVIYMANNLQSSSQTKDMLTKMQGFSMSRTGLPLFLCVDEEGGSVARVASNSAFGVTNVGDMSAIGATGDTQNAYNAGVTIGSYLSDLGFNVDFAPVADVLTNADNTVIGDRSFGTDSELVAEMVVEELEGLSSQCIYGTVKHFPGHGGTDEDSHDGAAISERTLEEIEAEELVPFQRAVDFGVSFVMVGHISLPNITGDNTPASLSSMLVTDVLRGDMGYDGIVITDAMNMGAITDYYDSAEAAVLAVQAGVDMILEPADFDAAYQGLLSAVQDGTISEDRIDESVVRIVRVKLEMEAE